MGPLWPPEAGSKRTPNLGPAMDLAFQTMGWLGNVLLETGMDEDI